MTVDEKGLEWVKWMKIDADAVTPRRNTRSIPSSPGQSLLKIDWQEVNVTQITEHK